MDGIIQTTKYVKFIKGTSKAYANLLKKDPDTLYFISDNDENGLLYLGTKLIGDGSGADLGKIAINEVEGNQVLSYDAENNQWVNSDIETLIREMVGATAAEDGMSGLVPAPKKGDENKFLRGDGKWISVSSGSLNNINSNIFENTEDGDLSLVGFEEATVGSIPQKTESGKLDWVQPTEIIDLINKDNEDPILTKSEVQNLINNSNHLKRAIVSSKDEMTDVSTIYMMLNGNNTAGNLYDEYMVLEDNDGNKTTELIAIGSGEVVLDNYVSKVDFNTWVGDINNLTHEGDIVTQINTLQEQMTWGELEEPVEKP